MCDNLYKKAKALVLSIDILQKELDKLNSKQIAVAIYDEKCNSISIATSNIKQGQFALRGFEDFAEKFIEDYKTELTNKIESLKGQFENLN